MTDPNARKMHAFIKVSIDPTRAGCALELNLTNEEAEQAEQYAVSKGWVGVMDNGIHRTLYYILHDLPEAKQDGGSDGVLFTGGGG
jgi:hypothetical protein